jgi:hypothetical protein
MGRIVDNPTRIELRNKVCVKLLTQIQIPRQGEMTLMGNKDRINIRRSKSKPLVTNNKIERRFFELGLDEFQLFSIGPIKRIKLSHKPTGAKAFSAKGKRITLMRYKGDGIKVTTINRKLVLGSTEGKAIVLRYELF